MTAKPPIYEAIVIGASAGGLKALKTIIGLLPDGFCVPILVVQHLSPRSDSFMAHYFNQISALQIKEADPFEPIRPSHIYIAPPNYHMLVEKDKSISLNVDQKVSYARPSIDVLFESAARVYQNRLIGVILTGANEDGAKGIRVIKEMEGLTIAQSPETAESPVMPQAAINTQCIDMVLNLEEIAFILQSLCR